MSEWWRPKAGVILSLLLFYLANYQVGLLEAGPILVYSLVTLTGFGLLGYFLNDWADIPFDEKVGKANLVSGINPVMRWLIAACLLVITLFPWFIFFKTDYVSWTLIVTQLALQFAYPIPPVRLKQFPRIAIVTDALYAFTIPCVLAWYTFDLTLGIESFGGAYWALVILGVMMSSIGARHIIAHHVADAENDRRTKTPNLALSASPLRLRKFIQSVLYPIELASAIAFFAVVAASSSFYPDLIVCVLVFIGARNLQRTSFGFSVGFGKTKTDKFLSFYLGLISSFLLAVLDIGYWLVVLVFLLLFTNVLSHPLRQVVLNGVIRVLTWPIDQGRLAVNWSVYYFRKWILNWSEEKNWGAHYRKYLSDLAVEERKKNGIVAVFNQNSNKYTETFVNGHLSELPFHVVPFYGWPSPLQTTKQEWLNGNNAFLRSVKRSFQELRNLDVESADNEVIAKRLIEERVQVMVAEFGMMGVRLLEISRLTGIPIIVIFYGYDAWHKRALAENAEGYKQLFRQASAVLGVSKDICNQLVELGCLENNVQYLPCYVNLELFHLVERDFCKKSILAVGRFCVTKSPQLTILAFNEVLKKHPDAHLRMIGEDEGGGILESCKVLVQSLGISEKVEFLGSLPPEKVAEEMHRATMFVQHSLTAPHTGDKEGTPVAVMEAMATGLPIVATKHAGIAEMIESGKSGILVDEFDYIRMAEEMTKLLDNPQLMKQIGDYAAESIRSNELVVNHIQHLAEIIKKHQVLV